MNSTILTYIYRPQRSWAKVMFLQASVILSTGGVSGRENPPGREPPGRETPPAGRPPQAGRTPPGRENPLAGRPPWKGDPPWHGDPPGIWSMSGRYASYWNAFLFTICVHPLYVLENGGVLECYTGNWLHEEYPSTSTRKLEEMLTVLLIRMIDGRTIGFLITVCIGKLFRK